MYLFGINGLKKTKNRKTSSTRRGPATPSLFQLLTNLASSSPSPAASSSPAAAAAEEFRSAVESIGGGFGGVLNGKIAAAGSEAALRADLRKARQVRVILSACSRNVAQSWGRLCGSRFFSSVSFVFRFRPSFYRSFLF